jgi:hypothetical protein
VTAAVMEVSASLAFGRVDGVFTASRRLSTRGPLTTARLHATVTLPRKFALAATSTTSTAGW